jgi:hypothetical protein
MRRSSSRRTRRIVVCLAILGVAGAGGLAAGFTARAGLTPGAPTASSSVIAAAAFADMPPSDIVNLRFPHEWVEPSPAVDVAPRMLAFAGDDGSFTLFSPRPIYPLPDVNAPAAETQVAEAPVAEAPEKQKPVGQPKIALASASSKPVVLAARGQEARPAARSNSVLNDSQIASIKKRLNLTPDQERYWPAVEAELRKMEYKKDKAQGTRTAQVDISKVDVQGLKSAGFPLVMSFSDEQRRELKSLAHLLGLDGVMSSL